MWCKIKLNKSKLSCWELDENLMQQVSTFKSFILITDHRTHWVWLRSFFRLLSFFSLTDFKYNAWCNQETFSPHFFVVCNNRQSCLKNAWKHYANFREPKNISLKSFLATVGNWRQENPFTLCAWTLNKTYW